MNRSTAIRFIAPLVALGCLALSFDSRAADAGVEVAAATPPKVKMPGGGDPKAPSVQAAKPAASKTDSSWGQVSGTAVNVRSGPGLDHSVLTTLKGGEFVKVGAINANWIEVEWPQNVAVWVARENVQIPTHSADKEKIVTVKAGAVARATGSRKAASLGALEPGTKLTVLSEAEGWLKVKPPAAMHAYISAKFVTLNVRKPVVTTAQADSNSKSVEAIIKDNSAAPVKTTKTTELEPIEQMLAPNLSATKKTESDRADLEAKKKASEAETLRVIAEQRELALRVVEARREEEIDAAHREFEAKELAAAAEAKQLAEKQEQFWKVAEARRVDELARAEAQKKAEQEEQVRHEIEARHLAQVAEAKRAEELARAEAQKKAALEEDARREAEAKHQAQIAEAKRAEEVTRAEAQKKAALEEDARRQAEAKRQAQVAEAQRVEAQKKAALEEQSRREAEAKRLAEAKAAELAKSAPIIEDEPDSFVAPVKLVARAPKFTEERAAVVTLSTLAEPTASTVVHAAPPKKPTTRIVVDPGVETTKADRGKFVLPNRAPKVPGNRAEVVEFSDDAPSSVSKPVSKDEKTTSQAETDRFVQPPATLVFPVKAPQASCLPENTSRQDACGTLPTPSGDAPISLRLPSFHEARVDPTETGAQVATAEGIVERRTAHPFENAGYALVRSGVTLYYLTARPSVNLDVMVGQKVRVSGVATTRTGATILEVATVTSQE